MSTDSTSLLTQDGLPRLQTPGTPPLCGERARSLALGQVLSILVTLTGVCSTLLTDRGINIPTFQNFLMYCFLALIFVPADFVATRRREREAAAAGINDAAAVAAAPAVAASGVAVPPPSPSHDGTPLSVRCCAAAAARAGLAPPPAAAAPDGGPRWWQWGLLALVDVEANTLVVAAYQYTTITSAMLLDCFTIPAVMLLSAALLGARYRRAHLGGALVCVAGLALAVLSDALRGGGGGGGGEGGGASGAARRVYGDALCVGASILYACSNVAQERLVRTLGGGRGGFDGVAAFLARLSVCGAAVAGAQALAVERGAIARAMGALRASRAPPLALAGYVLVLASAYGGASLFLAARDAALFNLSLLTSDAYAAAFAAVVARRALPLLYFVAFAVTALGLGAYHTAPPPTRAGGAPPLEPLVAECPPRQSASERL